jgi:hypothetical protein
MPLPLQKGGIMSGEDSRSLLLAKTLESILKKRFSQRGEGKAMVCLEGFPASAFQVLKGNYGSEAEIYWAGEEQGPELVRLRNDADLTKPLVIFSDAYFAESQSLAHISRITDNILLQDKQYLEALVKTAFKEKFNEVILEAVKQIMNIIKPSLEELADYLVEANAAPGDIYNNMGKELCLLGVFSHQNLVSTNLIKGSKTKDLLQKKFGTQLKNNFKYSRAAYRTRFTVKRLEASALEEHKNLLFDYSRGIKIAECYKEIDFEKIKSLLSRKGKDTEKKSEPPEQLEKNDNILLEMARYFNGKGKYNCRIGKGYPFDINIGAIFKKKLLLKPIEEFKEWTQNLKSELEKIESKIRDEDEDLEISIKLEGENSGIVFSIPDPLQYSEDQTDIKSLLESVKESGKKELNKIVEKFAEKRKQIPSFISAPFSVTLDFDIEGYIRSYLELLIILWENATQWAHQKWFHELLNELVTLDLGKKDNERVVKPSHPFALFRRRLIEALALELIENREISEESEDEENSLFNEIYKEAETHFSKNWPRYLALLDFKDEPLHRDLLDRQLIYQRHLDYNPQKPTLDRELNPQILSYIEKKPLARHTFFLKVLNPLDGEELFKAVQKLFEQRKKDNVSEKMPESIFLKAVGPMDVEANEPETLSYFDRQAESREQKQGEMFQVPPNRLHPFCRYEKELVDADKDGWLNEWIKKNRVGTSAKVDIADICIAMDPFRERHRVIDNFMPPGISEAIDDYFRDFKKGKIDLMEFLAGPDRIYVRLAFEALSIMVLKRGGERRKYDPGWMDTGEYMKLMECMKDKGEWKILVDNNLSDYYAEQLESEIEKFGEKVSTIVHESSTGTTYLFITPKLEQKSHSPKHWPWISAESQGEEWFKRFQDWLGTIYKDFIENKQYCEELYAHYCQWLIPLRYFSDWLIPLLFAEPDEEAIAEFLSSYYLRFQFKIEGDTIYYDAKLKEKLKDNKCQTIKNVKINMKFLNCDKPVIRSHYSLLDNLKRRAFCDVLKTFCTNPYQAWFLSLLKREEMKAIEKEELFVDDTAGGEKISLGKIAVWRLRMLIVYMIKFYSQHHGISADDRHTIMTLFEKIKEGCPVFLGDMVEHLIVFFRLKKCEFFKELFFLEKYKH